MKKKIVCISIIAAMMLFASVMLTGCKKNKEEVIDLPVAATTATVENNTSDKETFKEVASNTKNSVKDNAREDVKETSEVSGKDTATEKTKHEATKASISTTKTLTETTSDSKDESGNTSGSGDNNSGNAGIADSGNAGNSGNSGNTGNTGNNGNSGNNGSSTATPTEKPVTPPTPEATKPVVTPTPTPETTKTPVATPTPTPTPAHSHSWDGGTVTTAATCSAEGTKTYTCSCGVTKTESIPTTEHSYTEVVDREPGCDYAGWVYQYCTVCNKSGGGWSTEPLGHDVESYEKWGGDCVSPAQIGNVCRRCGWDLGDTYGSINSDNHNWITVSGEVWDDATWTWKEVEETKCSHCNTKQ